EDLLESLCEIRATFVTLEKEKCLRGCIGTLSAHDPLGVDTARNAYNAAFRDPRFPPVQKNEVASIEIHISILSPPEPFPVADEDDLLAKLRPGVDGVIITDGSNHATFLPSVWKHLPDPAAFVQELKMKAGLGPHHWSPTFTVERYTCESVS
ncbi:MAG TPA: AmmeMemoRadiSam system protein A, partial [Kiritimatiellia bacterium]